MLGGGNLQVFFPLFFDSLYHSVVRFVDNFDKLRIDLADSSSDRVLGVLHFVSVSFLLLFDVVWGVR